jgi:hypothetical protein
MKKLANLFSLTSLVLATGCTSMAGYDFRTHEQKFGGACRLPNGGVGATLGSEADHLNRLAQLRATSTMGAAKQADPQLGHICNSNTVLPACAAAGQVVQICVALKP